MSQSRSRAATRLLPRYREHREQDVATLRLALDREDFDAVARIGHNLRGNGRSYGFPEIAAMGEGLEVAASARSDASVRRLLAVLEAWLVHNRAPSAPAPLQPESRMRVRAASASPEEGEGRDDDDTD